ncbi:hypothetical protein [Streptomyces sp. NPDC048603]|uniref:hypothetical protein n=1 Tax=Streptomyces sp. NPDC048603 TaxID=3365577 RepID=UPI0037180C38
MGNNTSEDDRRSALMLRDAMEHAVEDLPTVNDLVPTAIVQGRRRKSRARAGIAATVVCVVGAVAFGSLALQGSDGATKVRPAASPTTTSSPSPTPEPYRTPVRIKPTREGEAPPLPPADRERLEAYQQRAAVLLDDLLPDAVGLIRPVEGRVNHYQGHTKDGKVFPVFLNVRPSDGPSRTKPCPNNPRITRCEQATLPGGLQATAYLMPSDSPTTTTTLAYFTYKTSDVSLTVYPSTDITTSGPVTGQELLKAVADPRFLDLVRYAHENPVQEKQTTIVGG